MQSLTFEANPTKRFFVSLLTKDIGTGDAILELVDNAISHVVTKEHINVVGAYNTSNTPLSKRMISVSIDTDSLSVSDNCGGISLKDARESILVFGSVDTATGFGLSVFGIGMKRACFKLGSKILIESLEENASTGFRLEWDVEKWVSQKMWNLDGQQLPAKDLALRKGVAGTTIVISELHDETRITFGSASFIAGLKDRISDTYMLFFKAGLEVHLNKAKISPNFPDFLSSDRLSIASHQFSVPPVEIDIKVGLTPVSDREPRGWYVFCNGRAVLLADKSELTGWGDVFPQFHTKFNHFLGLVFFQSEEPSALPWTTTKQGVVPDSTVYRRSLREMERLARPALKTLSDIYSSDPEMDTGFKKEILESASITPLKFEVPEALFEVVDWKKHSATEEGRISYLKPKRDIQALKNAIGSKLMSNKELGERTFEIAWNVSGVDEDE